MGLLSIFRRRADSASNATASAGGSADAVQRARSRARQRLIGAVVLVGVGIVGFPLVFETQPRPIPVDIPIEVPRKDSAPPLVMPAGGTPDAAAPSSATPAPAAEPGPAPHNDAITETRPDAGRDVTAASPAPATRPAAAVAAVEANGMPPEKSPPKAQQKAQETPQAKPQEKPPEQSVAQAAATPRTDGARARALLDGKPAAGAQAARFVVQVGAFADAGAARETRLKVEKLGLKTYTQVTATAAGNRIRVRVGPFGTRDEADKALAKARGAGISAVVLTL